MSSVLAKMEMFQVRSPETPSHHFAEPVLDLLSEIGARPRGTRHADRPGGGHVLADGKSSCEMCFKFKDDFTDDYYFTFFHMTKIQYMILFQNLHVAVLFIHSSIILYGHKWFLLLFLMNNFRLLQKQIFTLQKCHLTCRSLRVVTHGALICPSLSDRRQLIVPHLQ
jgi:hypothetical protein